MKRFLVPTLVLATLIVLPVMAPTSAQERDLGKEIDKLQEMVDELVEQTKTQHAKIEELNARLDAQGKEAAKLIEATVQAEKRGFALPAPNTNARLAFLYGVRRYAKVVTGSQPKGTLESEVKKAADLPAKGISSVDAPGR